MWDCIPGICFLIFIGTFILTMILYVISRNTKKDIDVAVGITAFICLLFLITTYITVKIRDIKNPKYVYESKLRDIEKAQKDLEKFLIDHPEFKEEQ